jgi:hypothetical protein
VVETSGGGRRRRDVVVADMGVGGWSDLQGEAPKEWMMGVSDGWIQAKEEVQNKRRTNERRKENRKGKYEENKKNTMGISFSYHFIQKKLFLPNVSLKCFQFHRRICFTNTAASRVVSATVVSNAPLKKRLAKQFLLAE